MRTLLIAGLTMLGVGSGFAQGTVVFGNASTIVNMPAGRNVIWGPNASNLYPALVTGANVSSNYGGLDLSGLRAQLFFTTTTSLDVQTYTPVAAAQNGVATFKQSTSTTAGSWFNKVATLNGATPERPVNLAVVVWQSDLDPDPFGSLAREGLHGVSQPFYYVPPATSPPPSEWLMYNFPGMTVDWAPEPTVALLAVTGIVIGWCRQRRRAAQRNGS